MIIEVLEPCWNGAMEARGEAPGLSNYIGRSTLCGCMDALETLAYGEVDRNPQRRLQLAARRARPDWQPKPKHIKWPKLTSETSAAILELLRKGVSYNGIVTTLATRGIICSRDQARRVARDHAIVRGKLAA